MAGLFGYGVVGRIAHTLSEADQRKLAVWEKGNKILGYDPRLWRTDYRGNLIEFSQYGNRDSEYGWEIDHIIPVASGGPDVLSNLRPLHWRANALRGALQRRGSRRAFGGLGGY